MAYRTGGWMVDKGEATREEYVKWNGRRMSWSRRVEWGGALLLREPARMEPPAVPSEDEREEWWWRERSLIGKLSKRYDCQVDRDGDILLVPRQRGKRQNR